MFCTRSPRRRVPHPGYGPPIAVACVRRALATRRNALKRGMGLADRDYMRERTRRRVARQRRAEAVLSWPPRPWMIATAAVLAVLILVYVY